MNRLLIALILALLIALPCLAQELPETLLRHDNFLVFDGHAGETITIDLESIPKASYLYGDDLLVEVIDPASERPLRELVPVSSTVSLEYPVTMDGTHAVRLASGQNTVRAQIAGAPWALVAWKNVPINISGAMSPLFFKVPAEIEEFSISLSASVTGEAAEVTILGPDGDVVLNEVGDYDTPETLTVAVPEGADDAVWELWITDPADDGLNLDDVQLYLAGRVPPFLSPNRDDVEVFAAGEQYQPDVIDVTVPVSGRQSLGAGESATLTWRMNALPEGKVYALRITGNDVDSTRELIVRINAGEGIDVFFTDTATTETFTLHIPREMLRVGENAMLLTQDPSGGSNTVVAEEIAILIGDRIREYRGY